MFETFTNEKSKQPITINCAQIFIAHPGADNGTVLISPTGTAMTIAVPFALVNERLAKYRSAVL